LLFGRQIFTKIQGGEALSISLDDFDVADHNTGGTEFLHIH
jgi:hypothetical protein